MPRSDHQPHLPFASLRTSLIRLPPTGEAGFEGLVAVACAHVARTPFRLIGSGRQFGRDAEAVVDGTGILFEAKRYNSPLSYAALSGKLQEALGRSGRRVEVWGVAATVPLDAQDSEDLHEYGEDNGVTVLLLNWAGSSPPLAVLLSCAREAVIGWCARNAPVTMGTIERDLDEVGGAPSSGATAQALTRELGRATLGLSRARRRNSEWLASRFGDRTRALHDFNQPLAPLDASVRPVPIPRDALERRVRDGVDVWSEDAPLLVLTGRGEAGRHLEGDEGVGKTWAIARAWVGMGDPPARPRPMLLVMPAHAWIDGEEQAPMRLLARLLDAQTGGSNLPREVERWERRIELWLDPSLAREGDRPTIVVVLDGVNERVGHPWAVLVASLCDLARTRPIRVVVTTRRGYHDRELAPRLGRFATRVEPVDPFSDEDLDAALRAEGRDPASVREPLRAFLRNPRILSVGLSLLDRLDPDEVGVERLLLEYLRMRQEERAPRASHTPEQFAQTLVRHARDLLSRLHGRDSPPLSVQFEERSLGDRLGLPPILAPMARDLQDIVDGRFLRIVDARRNRYSFTSEALPLALGLLVVDELDQQAREDPASLGPRLGAIVDPIVAIDATSDVLLVAFELALADNQCAVGVAEELLHRLLALQNLPEDRRARIFAGLRSAPSVYVAVTERLFGDPDDNGRRDWMTCALVERRLHDDVRGELDAAIRRWLRSWQRHPIESDVGAYPDGQREQIRARHAEAASEHHEALGALRPAEAAFVRDQLVELPQGRHQGVDQVAVLLLARRPLLGFADDLFAWCAAAALGWTSGSARAEMQWLRRLAPVDWEETTEAIGRAAAAFPVGEASTAFLWAVQYALYDGGDPAQARLADEAWPLLHDGPRTSEPHGLEGLCDVDPLDPEVEGPGTDLTSLMERYRVWSASDGDGLPPIMLRMRDTVFARARMVLCRFEHRFAAEVHRSLASRGPSIAGASPLVVANSLVHDAAILNHAEVDVLSRWLEALHRDPSLPRKEVDVSGPLLTAILPHLEAERQFEVHGMQRADVRDAFWLGRALKRLPDLAMGERLEQARASGDAVGLRLALHFAAETGAGLGVVHPAAASARGSDDPRTRGAALRSMVRLRDVDGMEALAASGWSWSGKTGQGRQLEDFCGSVALLKAREGSDDPTLIGRLHPALWSRAAERGGPAILARLAEIVVGTISDIPPGALPPAGVSVTVVHEEDGPSRDDLGGLGHSVGLSFAGGAILPDGTRRRHPDLGDFHALLQRLTDLGRDMLLYPMTSLAVDRLADSVPSAFSALVDEVEAAIGNGPGAAIARAATVLAHDVARCLSWRDRDRASALFARAADASPLYPQEMPISGLPRSTLLLWRAADVPAIVAQRRKRLDAATNDEAIAFEVLAAEMAGKRGEVVAYVGGCLTSSHPARIARAVTCAGFARADPALDQVFDDGRLRHGFLANVRSEAKRSYDEGRWSERWSLAAREAAANVDVWRFGELALSCADARSVLWSGVGRGGPMFETLRPLIRTALESVVTIKARHRRGRLFGERAPPEGYLPVDAAGDIGRGSCPLET